MKKLNARGFAHDVLLVGFVVIFAIAGVAYIVASRADSCPPVSGAVSDATSAAVSTADSGAVSDTNCAPVSAAASSPVSTATVLAGSCVITGVPANPTLGTVINPSVTFTNTGTQAFTPSGSGNIATTGDSGNTGNKGGPVSAVSNLQPGQSVTISTGLQYTVINSTAAARKVTFTVTSSIPGFSCAGSSMLPVATVVLAARCVISGVPALPKLGQTLHPYASVTNAGNQALTPRVLSTLNLYSSTNKVSSSKQSSPSGPVVKPGQTSKINLAAYTIPRRSSKVTSGAYTVSSTVKSIPFNCSSSFKLP